MKVFKLYGKILKKNITSIIIYIVVFMILTLLFINNNSPISSEFEESKVNVTLINNDGDTSVTEGLKNYLKNYVIYTQVEPEHIDDALYFREIYIAITIPENFTKDFLSGENPQIIEQSVPDAAPTVSINRAINKYLNLITLYANNTDESIDDIIIDVNRDLETEISTEKSVTYSNSLFAAKLFFNYLSYFLLIVIMTIVGIVMMRFKKTEIKRRMSVSPYTNTKVSLEITLGHFLFSIVILLLMIIVSFLFYPESMNTLNGVLFIINAFCVTFAILSFAYMISLLIKSENALSAAVNVISLGTSFLTGAFIPQELLGKGILTFAHVFPNFYYISNNERISYLTDFSLNGMSDILMFMIIQIFFAITFLILSIMINKKQIRQEN